MNKPGLTLRSSQMRAVQSDSSPEEQQRLCDIEAIRRGLLPQTENDRLIAENQIRGGVPVPRFI